jgi:hypothetical protein
LALAAAVLLALALPGSAAAVAPSVSELAGQAAGKVPAAQDALAPDVVASSEPTPAPESPPAAPSVHAPATPAANLSVPADDVATHSKPVTSALGRADVAEDVGRVVDETAATIDRAAAPVGGATRPVAGSVVEDAVATVDRIAAPTAGMVRPVTGTAVEEAAALVVGLAAAPAGGAAHPVAGVVDRAVATLGLAADRGAGLTDGAAAGGPAAATPVVAPPSAAPAPISTATDGRVHGVAGAAPLTSGASATAAAGRLSYLLASPFHDGGAPVYGAAGADRRDIAPANGPGGEHTGPLSGAVASAAGSSGAPALALLMLLALAVPKLLLSLKEAPAFLRPVAFVALLERPG